ncbi:BON domain-containing protein [Phenylobacterium sp.]|jgi:hypothetical protein|uniref:BON domain-containing protein n=1 Tax=Phenylobacterium sp. TaxID=1871053 RepID=UPI002F936118
MADRDEGGQAGQAQGGGYEAPGYGAGYGRDFGGGGRNQGFDGSHGEGYGGSLAPSDYREGVGGDAYGGGMSGADYERSFGARGEDFASGEFGADDRSWMDRRADDAAGGSGPHGGRGPRGWSRTDQRIHEAVSEALMEDRLLDAREIEVQVEGGVVTLTGEVPGASDLRHAENLARRCAGVGEVRNQLEVSGQRRPDLHLRGLAGGDQPNPYHPPGQDHAVTADQRNAQLGEDDGPAQH